MVSQSFSVLRREEDFFDVTLVSDDEIQISAHKLVLSACSGFFKSILKRNSHSHPLLYLSGVDSKSLGFVLDYIYHGEVQVYQHQLDLFLKVAQKLKIEGLLSTENPEPQKYKEYEEVPQFQNPKEETFSIAPQSDIKARRNSVRTVQNDKLVSVNDMSEVEDKVDQLIEKIYGKYYCKSCEYSSQRRSNVREHVEIHIEGLSYSCQFCDKTFRSKGGLRHHLCK